MSTSAPSLKASDRPLATSWWVCEAPLGVTLTLFGCATGVAYLGPKGEYVLSGSDSGDIFLWEARSGRLVHLLAADEQEPHIPEL